MNIAITFRQMDATEAMRAYATDKIGKVQKFLRTPMKGHVTLSLEKSEDMYASIDKVIDKLERQIREHHGVTSSKKKGAERASERLLADETGEE